MWRDALSVRLIDGWRVAASVRTKLVQLGRGLRRLLPPTWRLRLPHAFDLMKSWPRDTPRWLVNHPHHRVAPRWGWFRVELDQPGVGQVPKMLLRRAPLHAEVVGDLGRSSYGSGEALALAKIEVEIHPNAFATAQTDHNRSRDHRERGLLPDRL
jgi:hypothetical protein